MKKLILISFFVLFFLASSVSAQEEILIQVNLFNDGSASIVGSSTVDPEIKDIDYNNEAVYGLTQHLTNKHEEKWTFSLKINREFEIAYIKVVLPENAKLGTTYSNMEYFTGVEGNSIFLEFSGENIEPEINFYYEIVTEKNTSSGYYILLVAVIISIIIIVLWLIFRNRKKMKKGEGKQVKKSKKIKKSKKGFEEKLRLLKPILNERENKIINELLQHRKLKQNQLQSLTKIPKVSLSRHLANLENKNLIIKKSLGKTNIVQINKNFDKNKK